MSYQICVDKLTGILRGLPEFNLGVNVSQADYKILTGGFPQCIILFPGAFTQEPSTIGGPDSEYWIDWEIRCELYVRYDGDAISAANITKFRQRIIEQVARYPFLDDTPNVLLSRVRRGDQPIPVFRPDGTGPYFWFQNIIIHVREEFSISSTDEPSVSVTEDFVAIG